MYAEREAEVALWCLPAQCRRCQRVCPSRCFVDDSARTLLSCASDPRLLPVALHFASYGYSSAGQVARIGAVPRMRTVSRSQDLSSVLCAQGVDS